jgi:hypothetical protein
MHLPQGQTYRMHIRRTRTWARPQSPLSVETYPAVMHGVLPWSYIFIFSIFRTFRVNPV